MTDTVSINIDDAIAREAEGFAAERAAQVEKFVKTNPEYYREQFARIGSDAKFVPAFNLWAGLLGPIWFSTRRMWNWGLSFLILETLAAVQIVRGLFGDLAYEAWERIAKIEGTLELRRQQLASAIENNTDKIDVYRRTVESLENAIGGIRQEAQQLEEAGLAIAIIGFIALFADNACFRLHDSCYRLLWHRQARCRRDNDDIRRYTGSSPHCTGFTRRTRARA